MTDTFSSCTPIGAVWVCVCAHSVCMALSDEKVPLAMVCSLLSYSESRLRLWRSWKASTRRHAILLAFSSLRDGGSVTGHGVTFQQNIDANVLCVCVCVSTHNSCRENSPSNSALEISVILFPYRTLWSTNTAVMSYECYCYWREHLQNFYQTWNPYLFRAENRLFCQSYFS